MKELASPPDKVVWWVVNHKGPQCLPPMHTQAKTAFEAARNLGMALSECGQMSWQEEEPLLVGWA